MWSSEDRRTFTTAPSLFTMYSPWGIEIVRCINKHTFANVVEIGTNHGLGSTTMFLCALPSSTRFYTVESNSEKYAYAVAMVQSIWNSRIHTAIVGSVCTLDDVSSAMTEFPDLARNTALQQTHDADLKNMILVPNALEHLPDQIDFLLLDGGEIVEYFDFLKLLPRCRMYIATTCAKVWQHLIDDEGWRVHFHASPFTIFIVASAAP